MSAIEDILKTRSGIAELRPGQLVTVPVDHVYLQDGNTPTVRRLMSQHAFYRVFDPKRISVFFDHSVLSPAEAMTDRLREAEAFAHEFNLQVYRAGRGISHVVALEEGIYQPGAIVVGADSHTCTGGVVQCLSLGMGASDIVASMVTGQTWLRVPETIWISVAGKPSRAARSKDVVLYALSTFGQKPFLYKSVQWYGEWFNSISLDSAATVANMGVELGCKCCFLPENRDRRDLADLSPKSDEDARVLKLDVEGLPPMVARPHEPGRAVPLNECAGQVIDYVFIGTCTNGRLDDLAEVATIVRDQTIARNVHCIVTPGSLKVYREALSAGIIDQLVAAGALVTPPGCGACVGTQGTVPASDDRVLATSARNFRGRMGARTASIWLSSPAVAAFTALLGHIPDLEEMDR
jgi:3-isopropylmalate/(R)-2-methylmalate dehydratase large subunit